jgi:hypothetical protein
MPISTNVRFTIEQTSKFFGTEDLGTGTPTAPPGGAAF